MTQKVAIHAEAAGVISPEAGRAVQRGVGWLESGAKKLLNTPIPRTPEVLPERIGRLAVREPFRKGVDKVIENPEILLGTATPIPGGGLLAHAGKRALERGLNSLAAGPKLAFAVSQYSGALNPVIHSGASVLPPAKMPRLGSAVQKTAFATSSYDAGPAPTWAHGQAAPSGASDIPAFKAPRLNAAVQKTAAGAPTRGNFMMASDIPPFRPPRLDRAIQKDGELETEPRTNVFKGASDVRNVFNIGQVAKAKGVGRVGELLSGSHARRLKDYAQTLHGHADTIHPSGHMYKTDEQMKGQLRGLAHNVEDEAAQERVDVRGARRTAGTVAVVGGLAAHRLLKKKPEGKEKDSDALPEGMALQPWDNFKRSKYAMPTEKLAAFVEGLLKEAIPGLTPQSRLEQSSAVGAPRVNPPPVPGPSIADQAKPKGPGFGTGIAGANKNSIGGQSVGGIGRMASPPQL
jgi:hypothetical protein